MPALLALMLVLAAASPAPASAETLFVTFTGSVTDVPAELAAAFGPGDPIEGSFQIESTTPDTEPSPTEGEYAALSALSFSIGAYAVAGAAGDLHMRDGSGFMADDFFVSGLVSGDPVGGLSPIELSAEVADSTLAAFASDDIPASLDLADFDVTHAFLSFGDGGSTFVNVVASIDTLTYSTVPEPAAALLLQVGAAVLWALRRRR